MRKIRDVKRNAQINQSRYEQPKQVIWEWFNTAGIRIDTDIWIHPRYPYGWDAVLGAWDRVWVIRVHKNQVTITDIQHVQGFKRNGTLIVS